MKHLLLASLFLAAPVCSRAATPEVPDSAADTMIVLPSNAYASLGMRRDEVVNQFGAPDDKLSADIWVYWNFRAKRRPAGENADTLIVAFAGDRVTRLRLTRREPVLALLKQVRANAAARTMVASK